MFIIRKKIHLHDDFPVVPIDEFKYEYLCKDYEDNEGFHPNWTFNIKTAFVIYKLETALSLKKSMCRYFNLTEKEVEVVEL